jgi:hypothetical protein
MYCSYTTPDLRLMLYLSYGVRFRSFSGVDVLSRCSSTSISSLPPPNHSFDRIPPRLFESNPTHPQFSKSVAAALDPAIVGVHPNKHPSHPNPSPHLHFPPAPTLYTPTRPVTAILTAQTFPAPAAAFLRRPRPWLCVPLYLERATNVLTPRLEAKRSVRACVHKRAVKRGATARFFCQQ